ncbi:MAG TPA: D-hexose-6-phosphate mutarotase [Mariprofundaceae bacterium]|nr:D-hexose-6-phosphate mutarotase [Mariprofundaceae bacterium]
MGDLNQAFGIEDQVVFIDGPGGMPIVRVNNELGEASIALQGAHVLGFQARGQEPIIWMSDEATYAQGKSLRGGVPVCWPWFGPHGSDSTLPGHGPARTVNWKPVASEALGDGSTKVSFELVETDKTRQQIPHLLRVQLHVTVGSSLRLELETTNLGKASFTLGEALHTYFLVGDVRLAHVEGLDGCEYIDKMDGGARKQQHGPVSISSETDRIYLGTGGHSEIIDPAMGRKIVIESQGSASMVVWNPWVETAAKMGDLGPDGYLKMLCVETANAADDVVLLKAGGTHCMAAEYSSESL